MSDLIDPKDIVIKGQDGKEYKFTISKMPYASGGREVLTQYIPTAMPNIGNYALNHELMLIMMSFIAVKIDGFSQRLVTAELVDNHVTDFRVGVMLEKEMMEYNFGFFDLGKISTSLEGIATIVREWIISTLTASQERLSQKEKQPSKS